MQWAQQVIAKKLRALGRTVSIRGPGGEIQVRAIIDPVSSVSNQARTAHALADGYYPPGSYQYFGPPEGDLTEAEMVAEGEILYIIRRRELYRVEDRPLYWWALMIRGGDGDA